MSRLTYTKSNFELEPLVRDFKTVRENMGQVKLKRYIAGPPAAAATVAAAGRAERTDSYLRTGSVLP